MKRAVLSLASLAARWLPMPVKRAVYRIGPLARLVRGGLNRAAPQGLATVRVAAGGLAGAPLLLDLQSEKDYWLGTYEPELQEAVRELVRPGMTVYDVGANIGYITLLLARAVGESGRVSAFEALPANVERLKANLRLNGVEARVTVFAGAVVDSTRAVEFLVGPSGGMGKAEGSAGRQEASYAGKLAVAGTSLDDYVFESGNPPPEVVKMDIEGGEVLALPGMRRVLREARPALLIELHGQQASRAAWETLIPAGYRVCRMQAGFPGVRSLEELGWKAYLVGLPLETGPAAYENRL